MTNQHTITLASCREQPKPGSSPPSGTLWRHYKGRVYLVTGLGLQESSSAPQVIYAEISPPYRTWLRPLAEWQQETGLGPRFVQVEERGS